MQGRARGRQRKLTTRPKFERKFAYKQISRFNIQGIHDFRGFLLRFYNIFIFDKDWMNKYQEDLGMSIREFYQTMGLTDINHCMLFFDRYIQYLHQFIETGRFTKIAAVNNIQYKRGWCKLVFMDYEKHDDGKWYWVE